MENVSLECCIVKLPAHRAGLPGNEISFFIVPLDPAYKARLAGHLPIRAASRVIVASLLNVLAPRQDGVCHWALNDEKRFKHPHMRSREQGPVQQWNLAGTEGVL
jgi:hypothetical protein